MKASPYLIGSNAHGSPLTKVDPNKLLYREDWLQELLRMYPDILPVNEIEQVFAPLVPIGREVPVRGGFIDNLFISRMGYPVLVETKLWRNPEAKRVVVAQAIEYAGALNQWSFSDLDTQTRAYLRKYENKNLGLIDWVEESTGPLEVDSSYFEETVTKNLRLGRFLVMVVSDQIRSELIDTIRYVNRFPHLAVNVALVEMQCFQVSAKQEWPILVVPVVVAKTEIVERSIVEVNVSVEGKSTVQVRQEKPEKTSSVRVTLTEDAFWDQLKNSDPAAYPVARQLVEYYRSKEEVTVSLKTKSIAFYVFLPDANQQISLFFISTQGIIDCWHGSIADQFEKAGLDLALLESYKQDLSSILRQRTEKLSMHYPANQVDPDRLIAAVDAFIDSILTASPELD